MRFLLIFCIGVTSTLAASVLIPELGEHEDSYKFEVEIKNAELDPKEELSPAVKSVHGGMLSKSDWGKGEVSHK